jgi:hypothetical protein
MIQADTAVYHSWYYFNKISASLFWIMFCCRLFTFIWPGQPDWLSNSLYTVTSDFRNIRPVTSPPHTHTSLVSIQSTFISNNWYAVGSVYILTSKIISVSIVELAVQIRVNLSFNTNVADMPGFWPSHLPPLSHQWHTLVYWHSLLLPCPQFVGEGSREGLMASNILDIQIPLNALKTIFGIITRICQLHRPFSGVRAVYVSLTCTITDWLECNFKVVEGRVHKKVHQEYLVP